MKSFWRFSVDRMSVLALFCFLTIVSVVRSDLYGCNQETSCKTCIKQYVLFMKKLTYLSCSFFAVILVAGAKLTLCTKMVLWDLNVLESLKILRIHQKTTNHVSFLYSCSYLSETYCFRDLPIKLSKFVLPFLSLQQQDLPMC